MQRARTSRARGDLTVMRTVARVHVFYPEATEPKCTAGLLLDVDPVLAVTPHRG